MKIMTSMKKDDVVRVYNWDPKIGTYFEGLGIVVRVIANGEPKPEIPSYYYFKAVVRFPSTGRMVTRYIDPTKQYGPTQPI